MYAIWKRAESSWYNKFNGAVIWCLPISPIFFFFTSLLSILEICFFLMLIISSIFLYCRDKLVIAPYGFDKSTWDPSKDNFLPKNYSAEDMKGKTVCKVALQQHLALSGSASSILVSFAAGVIFKLCCFFCLDQLIISK